MNRGVLTTIILHSLCHNPSQIHVKTTRPLPQYSLKIPKKSTLSRWRIELISYGWKRYVRESAKIGRNDSCTCGSGLKYKKCCLKNKQK